MNTDLKKLEHDVIGSMRTALAHFDTDHAVVRENRYKAHDLFAEYLNEWSEDFCTLYRAMLEIFNMHTPKEKGHYRVSHIGIGYSSFAVSKWVADKVQPAPPTVIELVVRFDVLIQVWSARSDEVASCLTNDASCPNGTGDPGRYRQ